MQHYLMWILYSWLKFRILFNVIFKIFEPPMSSKHSECIYISCSVMWSCLKISIWPDVVILMFHIYTHRRPV